MSTSDTTFLPSEELARRLRLHALQMVAASGSSHIGSCLSLADILAVLYDDFLSFRSQEPQWADRDRVIVSKGHAAAIVYAVLAESGFFPKERLARYAENGQPLSGHVTHSNNPGVEVSSGSLGHGLSLAAGFALAGKRQGRPMRSVAILSDGECDEGSIWEAVLFAPHHQLSNLIAIVDFNKIQSFGRVDDVLPLEPFAEKWQAFGWHVQELDGHDHHAIAQALSATGEDDRPSVLICHTIKGKGVSFMEDDLLWHYRSPSVEQLEQAIEEVSTGVTAS